MLLLLVQPPIPHLIGIMFLVWSYAMLVTQMIGL